MSGETISIRTNFPDVARALNRLADDVGNKAMVRALNTTLDAGKVAMAKAISQEFVISSADVKARLAIQRARAKGGNLSFEAVLSATRKRSGRSMNLIAFVEKSVTLAEGRRRAKSGSLGQLRFQIKRGGGKKMIQGAFIGNKGRTVFVRDGQARFPIRPLNTIDVVQMFNTKRINAVVRETILARFQTNFNREMRAVLGGFAK